MYHDGQNPRLEVEQGTSTLLTGTKVASVGADDDLIIEVHVDSDWAKGPEGHSKRGGMMMVNGIVVKHWLRSTQYHAVVTGAAAGLGMQLLLSGCGAGGRGKNVDGLQHGRSSSFQKRLG